MVLFFYSLNYTNKQLNILHPLVYFVPGRREIPQQVQPAAQVQSEYFRDSRGTKRMSMRRLQEQPLHLKSHGNHPTCYGCFTDESRQCRNSPFRAARPPVSLYSVRWPALPLSPCE